MYAIIWYYKYVTDKLNIFHPLLLAKLFQNIFIYVIIFRRYTVYNLI